MPPDRNASAWRDWRTDHPLWVELFVLFNFGGLIGDIFLAHSQNGFRRGSEYIPLYFSIAATVTLACVAPLRARMPGLSRTAGHLIGWLAVVVGLTGVILHLDSQFFVERTIRSLTYAAPFAAPLAYTGLGFLLLANRLVDPRSPEWPLWVLLLALGGFIGNFVFSLSDHAQNGFYNPLEWLPVISSAVAVGSLAVPFVTEVTRSYVRWCAWVLGTQAVIGVAGFVLHAAAVTRQPAASWFEKVLTGAPPLAPLLFPNLVVLAAIGLWVLNRGMSSRTEFTGQGTGTINSERRSPTEDDRAARTLTESSSTGL
ncbi:MAG: hypothetical protein ABI818_20815 [Acidobacteriota bacterium]